MAVEIITSLLQICDASGNPLSGAKIHVYAVNTTTPLSLFSDTGLSVSAANPIVTDSAGRHAMRYVATGSYKIYVTTSADVPVPFERDNIDGRVPVGSGALAIANGGTGATTAGAALSALGAATADELADIAADVAAISGSLGSVEKTHIATGTTAQRPGSPVEGDIRRNTTVPQWEGYVATWQKFLTDDDIASAAEVETATSNAKLVTPGRVKSNPGVAKAWGYITYSAGTPSVTAGHNVTIGTDHGTGDVTLNFTTPFSSASYCVVTSYDLEGGATGRLKNVLIHTKAAGSVRIKVGEATGNSDTNIALGDVSFHFMAFGDQ